MLFDLEEFKMINLPNIISRAKHTDDRGSVTFVNEFDMGQVKRFYVAQNKDADFITGWRGHKVEQRWFFAIAGAFDFKLVRIDDCISPNPREEILPFQLSS